MGMFMTMGRYSAQGAAAVTTEGLAARKKAVEAFLGTIGHKLVGYWGVREADWDFVIISEGEDVGTAYQLATQLTTRASGAFEETRWFALAEAEDVDAAMGRVTGYRAPGAAS
jgi:uncharacterized protein with GYD domain